MDNEPSWREQWAANMDALCAGDVPPYSRAAIDSGILREITKLQEILATRTASYFTKEWPDDGDVV